MSNFNKGDISEGILAAAITARFISKTKKISFQDVIMVIKKLGKPNKLRNFMLIEKEFDSPNKNPRIIDNVICKITLAEVNMLALLNQKIYASPDIKSLVNAAICPIYS
jgi:hypothetical protein